MSQNMLTKEAILTADDLPREKVNVPQWGGDVWVRALTAQEATEFGLAITEDGKDNSNCQAELAVKTIVNEEGVRLFNDGDAIALGNKSRIAVNTVFEIAQRLSGLDAETVEVLEGNSEGGMAADSHTA